MTRTKLVVPRRPGRLFVFEGIDGSGKTTLSKSLASRLEGPSTAPLWLSFPGREGNGLGALVYDIHHGRHDRVSSINPTSLQLLHVAAHIDVIAGTILPALAAGADVVLDRFWWSTWVYGMMAAVDASHLRMIIDLEKAHWRGVYPNAVFLVSRTQKNAARDHGILASFYAELATTESGKYPVRLVDNDSTVGAATSRIVALIEGSESNERPRPASARQLSLLASAGDPKSRKGQGNSHLVISSRIPAAKPTVVFDTYWRFAIERQAIFFRRLAGLPYPWTDDPVLVEHKFTNAYRASDRVSQFLIRHVIYGGDQRPEELFFRVMLFKLFNKIETWLLLERSVGSVVYSEFDVELYDRVLCRAMDSGAKIYSGAYIMPSGGAFSEGGRKHRMHLRLLDKMMRDGAPAKLRDLRTMREGFDLLRSYPTIGDFLAYQFITDLNYSTITDFSEMEFVVPGPGARDGLRKCFSDFGGLAESELIRWVADHQNEEFDRLGLRFQTLWGRPLQLIDCQNLFCEVDKYSRVVHPEVAGRTGRKRIKQKYRPTVGAIAYAFPPKWRLDTTAQRQDGDPNVSSD